MIGNGQSGKASSSQSEAFTRVLLLAHAAASRDKILHLHLAAMPLKRKAAARGKRAPHMPSIADEFCRLPSPVCAVGNVVLDGCHLVLAAARAPLAMIDEDAQNGNRRATTRGELTGVGTAVPSPRFDEPTRLFRGGRSDSPAQ